MPTVSVAAPAPNTWNVNQYCCSTNSLALEVNCRWAYSLSSLSTCPALSRVSFLSFCKPGSARDIRSGSVCSSDQGTTHQPDSLTIAAPLLHPQCLLLQTGEYEYLRTVPCMAPQANDSGRLRGETGMRKSLRKSSYYKVESLTGYLGNGWGELACACSTPLLNPGIASSCILCPGRPRCLLPWEVVVDHGWIKKARGLRVCVCVCVCVCVVDEAYIHGLLVS